MEGAAGDLVGLVGFEPICPPVMSRAHVPDMLKANNVQMTGCKTGYPLRPSKPYSLRQDVAPVVPPINATTPVIQVRSEPRRAAFLLSTPHLHEMNSTKPHTPMSTTKLR